MYFVDKGDIKYLSFNMIGNAPAINMFLYDIFIKVNETLIKTKQNKTNRN